MLWTLEYLSGFACLAFATVGAAIEGVLACVEYALMGALFLVSATRAGVNAVWVAAWKRVYP